MRVPFFVVVALLAVVLPAQAGKPSKNERRAIALINRAVSGATKSVEQCRQRPPEGTFTHDAPSSELLALLGILRRPATPEDSPPGDGMRFLPATDVYADYIRLAHTTDGRSWWITRS